LVIISILIASLTSDLITRSSVFFFLFFYCSRAHPDLHSFPTRRSSDLRGQRPLLLLRALRQSSNISRRQRPGCIKHYPNHPVAIDRKSTRLNSSHRTISYAVFCLKKKKKKKTKTHKKKNTNKEKKKSII